MISTFFTSTRRCARRPIYACREKIFDTLVCECIDVHDIYFFSQCSFPALSIRVRRLTNLRAINHRGTSLHPVYVVETNMTSLPYFALSTSFALLLIGIPTHCDAVSVSCSGVAVQGSVPTFGPGTSTTSGDLAVARPEHGCWVDPGLRYDGQVVFAYAKDPASYADRCSFSRRVAVLQRAGAISAVIASNRSSVGGIVFGWAGAIDITSTLLNRSSYDLLRNHCRTGDVVTVSRTASAAATGASNAVAAFVAVISVIYACAGVLCAQQLVFRAGIIRFSEQSWSLDDHASLIALAGATVTSVLKIVGVVTTFEWAWEGVGWIAFVLVSELPDIALYNTLAVYAHSWVVLSCRLSASKRTMAASRMSTVIFLIAYTLTSLASIITGVVSPAGVQFRVATLLAGWTYLVCILAAAAWRLRRTLSTVSSRGSSHKTVVFVAICMVALAANGAVLIVVAAAGASLTGDVFLTVAVVAAVSDVVLVVVVVAMYVLSGRLIRSASTSSQSHTSNRGQRRAERRARAERSTNKESELSTPEEGDPDVRLPE